MTELEFDRDVGLSAHARFLCTERFGSLDGLRCLAILFVVFLHSPVEFDAVIASRGQMGVHLFFAISGFLITSLLIRERMTYGSISLRAFYIRRSLRIFPLYYAVLGVYIFAVLAMERDTAAGAEFFANLPYFLTYTSNWFVTSADERVIFLFAWSLAAEEQFYLTWPWVERYAGHRTKLIVLAMLTGLVAAVHFGLLRIDSFAHTVLWSVAPGILFGVALAHLLHSQRGFELAWNLIGHRAAAPLALLAAIVVLSIPPSTMAVEYAAYISLALLVATCVIREDNGLAKLLKLKPLVRIGVVSYGIYLMHSLAIKTVEAFTDDPWTVLIGGTLLVWAVAEISFATFERFFLRLRHGRLGRHSDAAAEASKTDPSPLRTK